MPLVTNENFGRLLQAITAIGDAASVKASTLPEYQQFIAAFPLERLKDLSADEYCVGKGTDSFCRWLERGLEPVLGRYMPGTSRGHLVYFTKADGEFYKHRRLKELSDEAALRYTLKVQWTVASANLEEDPRWIDDDGQIYERAGAAPRVTMGHGRKLRLLSAYHPDDVIPISSSNHVGHFLAALGCSAGDIPPKGEPVARMLLLKQYYRLARQTHPELSTRGFMLALYDKELGIAPAKPDDEVDTSLDEEDEASPAYLLTWNPENFKIGGNGDIEVGADLRWTCHSKQPQPGDTVYLIRLGVEPRGIVVKGTVTEGSHEAPHWKDPSKPTRYIRFRIDEARPSAAQGLLPMALLTHAAPEQRWSPQSSGVGIAPAAEAIVRRLWDEGRGKHSLRQALEWFAQPGPTAEPALADWLPRYRDLTARVAALPHDPAQMDEQVLAEMWGAQVNGVANVGQGALSSKELSSSRALLADLSSRIVASPSAQTLAEVEGLWRKAVQEGSLRILNRAVIRRAFASASPRRFTSLLRDEDCQRIRAVLERQFELLPEGAAGNDWATMNAQLTAAMEAAGLNPDEAEERNVALWRLLQHLSSTDTAASAAKGTGAQTTAAASELPRALIRPRNLILHGPPGTGKTYGAVQEAVSLLAPELLEGEPDRATIKARFDEYVAAGRIVFTTFHQSFSYEDFVEGLRAEADDEGRLRYTVASGVFKTLCHGGTPQFVAGEQINGYEVLRWTPDVLELRKPNGKVLPIGMQLLLGLRSLVRSGRITISDISQKQVFEKVPDTDLEPYLVNGYYNVLPHIVERMVTTADPVPRVLIIDEINRGNVARIFGELITLIEPSKRAGMSEALFVTLPYSKERLTVPSNLHIIGTMNTADRSLVGLDVALRRRFEFRELEPRPELLDGVAVNSVAIAPLLRAMNERIELLLDRDHRLGHAYFLSLVEFPTMEELAKVFRSSVLPLLLEYFFDDLERVRWVLNDHCKPAALQFLTASQAAVQALTIDGIAPPARGTRWVVNDAAFRHPDAYAGIVPTAPSL